MSEIVSIKAEQIYPHPENPRKDLGDLTELTESIRKKGVMQNLTVIPGHYITDEEWKEMAAQYKENPTEELRNRMNTIHTHEMLDEGYTLIIGHRRCAASKLAGIKELPCRIVENMSEKEQIATMLEENMQRNDLTYYEQAWGFQMMLDLGETEDTIAEKTGFSKTTIRHRLNIAKLDKEELKKKENDANFQLSLRDLTELEKVEDIEQRNKILKNATDSRDLVWKAQSAVAAAEREKKAKQIEEMIKKAGIKKAPKGVENEMYTGKWEFVEGFNLYNDIPEKITLPKDKSELFFLIHFNVVRIIRKKNKEETPAATPEELERGKRDKSKKIIHSAIKEMDATRKEFIRNIIDGKIQSIKKKDEPDIKDAIWKALVSIDTSAYFLDMIKFFTGKASYDCTDEEKQETEQKIDSLSCLHQMLIMLHYSMERASKIYDYYLHYQERIGRPVLKAYEILEKYGWSFANEDDRKILDGTYELYEQDNKE